MTLVSPATVRLPLVAAPAPVYPMRSRTLLLDAANLKRTELVLDDVRCQLDPDSTEGKEMFGANKQPDFASSGNHGHNRDVSFEKTFG